jgi:hypothetical protein
MRNRSSGWKESIAAARHLPGAIGTRYTMCGILFETGRMKAGGASRRRHTLEPAVTDIPALDPEMS